MATNVKVPLWTVLGLFGLVAAAALVAMAMPAQAQWQKGSGQMTAIDPVDQGASYGHDLIRLAGTSTNTGGVNNLGDIHFWVALNTCTNGSTNVDCSGATAMPRKPTSSDFASTPINFRLKFFSSVTGNCYVVDPDFVPMSSWTFLDLYFDNTCAPNTTACVPSVGCASYGGYAAPLGYLNVVLAEIVCNEVHYAVPRTYLYAVSPPPTPVPDGSGMDILGMTTVVGGTLRDVMPIPTGSAFVGTYVLGQQGPSPNPTGLTATYQTSPSPSHVYLDWTAPVGGNMVTGYRVERRLTPSGSFSTIATIGASTSPATDYTDTPAPSPPGTYEYRVTALRCNDLSVVGSSIMAQVVVPPQPLACTASVTTANPGDTVTYTLTGGTPNYAWSGGGTPASQSSSSTTFATQWSTGGSKIVSISDAGTPAQSTTCPVVTVSTPPPAQPVCAPAAVTLITGDAQTFTVTGGSAPYTWSGGGTPQGVVGASSFTTTYNAPGVYVVRVDSPAGSDTCDVTVFMEPLYCAPGAQTRDVNTPVSLTATGGDGIYKWTAAGATPDNAVGAAYTTVWKLGGYYTASVTSADMVAQCQVYVYQPCGNVEASFVPSSTSPRVGEAVTFQDASSGTLASYTWQFGDGASSTVESPVHTYNAPGIYNPRLTVVELGSGCGSIYDIEILVGMMQDADASDETPPLGTSGSSPGMDAPIADAGGDLSVEEGETVVLQGGAVGEEGSDLRYQWSLKQGPAGFVLGTTNKRALTFEAPELADPGTPWVLILQLRASRGASTSVADEVVVTVTSANQRPVANAGEGAEYVRGETIALDGDQSADPEGKDLTYTWRQVGDGPEIAITGADTAMASFVAPTDASVRSAMFELTVSDGRWTSVDGVQVWFKDAVLPVIQFTATPQSDPTLVAFEPSSTTASLRWEFGDGNTSEESSPVHQYAKPGTYKVTLTVLDQNGKSRDTTQDITVASADAVGTEALAVPWVLLAGLCAGALLVGAGVFLLARRRK